MKIIASLIFLFVVVGNDGSPVEDVTRIRKDRYEVRDEQGNMFSLMMPVSEVMAKLGEPDELEDMWAKYPNASCKFYCATYDEGIEFHYTDVEMRIRRIRVLDDSYYVTKHDFRIGDTLGELLEKFGRETSYLQEDKGKNGERDKLWVGYSTNDHRIIYTEGEEEYPFGARFQFDYETRVCEYFYLAIY